MYFIRMEGLWRACRENGGYKGQVETRKEAEASALREVQYGINARRPLS